MSNQLPEAPASVTYSLITPNGFPILFTKRANTGTELLTEMEGIEAKLLAKGFKPQENKQSGFQKKEVSYVEGKTCPKCNSKLVIKEKADGTKYEKCSSGKWDYVNKVASGCDYVNFNNK